MKLHLNTVSNALWSSLVQLMKTEEFDSFRIVGGTSLSLQLGHRESIDIDLFTDIDYGSLDFNLLEEKLNQLFQYVESSSIGIIGMGKSYFIGSSKNELVKLDLCYTDPFVYPIKLHENVRFSSLEEIAAMKLEIMANGGRKKDFWDLHELLRIYRLEELFSFYKKRYPYGSLEKELLQNLIDFTYADGDFTPNCYRNKAWELIKIDFENLVKAN